MNTLFFSVLGQVFFHQFSTVSIEFFFNELSQKNNLKSCLVVCEEEEGKRNGKGWRGREEKEWSRAKLHSIQGIENLIEIDIIVGGSML